MRRARTERVSVVLAIAASLVLASAAAAGGPLTRKIEVPAPPKPGGTAMVIVVEENESQSYSATMTTLPRAFDDLLALPLEQLDLGLPGWAVELVRQSARAREQVLRTVRDGLTRMMADQIREAGKLPGGPPCLSQTMDALAGAIAAPGDSGDAFLDRHGERALAECLRSMAAPYYDRVEVLTDGSATFYNFLSTLRRLHGQGYRIDLLIDVHGCGNPQGEKSPLNSDECGDTHLAFTDRDVSPWTIGKTLGKQGPPAKYEKQKDTGARIGMQALEGPALNLNAVYMVSCWGSNFNKTWIDLGATGANGSREINYYVLVSPIAFMHHWTEGGLTLRDAAARAYDLERSLFNGKKLEIAIKLRNPLTGRVEKVRIKLGVTYRKLMDRVLARTYGYEPGRPIHNRAASGRVQLGSSSVRRATTTAGIAAGGLRSPAQKGR